MLHKNPAVLVFALTIILASVFLHSLKNQLGVISQINSDKNVESLETSTQNLPSINIDYLRNLKIDSPALVIEETLSNGSNYKRYIASYDSSGNKIFGLLTVPNGDIPEGGFSAIVFNHGYIQPAQYKTAEKYIAYVGYLARNGFVVFNIDMRGHGNSEGVATGSYFSSKYTIDAISALKSLQKLDYINPQKIGMWGHSMAGNLSLRASLVEPDIKAVVIWAGAVYSYQDFAKFRLNDNNYVRRPSDPHYANEDLTEEFQSKVSELRDNSAQVNFNDEFWTGVSLTKNLKYLNIPIQIHHSVNDPVVNVGYSRDLAEVLKNENKQYELFEYQGGGHSIDSPYFEQAIKRTVEFFNENL